MKKNCIILLLLCCLSTISNAQITKEVLFLGNSYTYVNNLPTLIQQIALTNSDTLIFDSNCQGGYRFLNHTNDPNSLQKINAQLWDFVVLQGQSQETSWTQAQMQTEVFPAVATLVNNIRQKNSTPLFFMTWGRENGDAQNCPYLHWVCTYQGMDSAIHKTYCDMAQTHHSIVSPVGAVWNYLRTYYPQLPLYSSDHSHPSLLGSYAAACSFYTIIFHKSPINTSVPNGITDKEYDIIKQVTHQIIIEDWDSWDFQKHSNTSNQTSQSTPEIELSHTNLQENAILDIYHLPLHETIQLELASIEGKQILKADFYNKDSTYQIDMQSLHTGLYILKVTHNNHQIAFKIMR